MKYLQSKYVVLYKDVGETPLVVVERFRSEAGLGKALPLSYAGRLDPMASGKLLVLIGDECKRQRQYHGLDKEYVFDVLFDCASDSGDVLGLAHHRRRKHRITASKLRRIARKFRGRITMPYPAFSSKTVNGKPLFLWALENRLHEIRIPKKNSYIHRLQFKGLRAVTASTLHNAIISKINSIPIVTDPRKQLGHDFRRDPIRQRWSEIFGRLPKDRHFHIARFRCIASSGTYMRSLAEHIAREAGTQGLAFAIHRTHIGRYKKFGPFGWWKKRY